MKHSRQTPYAQSPGGRSLWPPALPINLSHLYLNALGVLLAVSIPRLPDRVIAAADTLATGATQRPWLLLAYLAAPCVGTPMVVSLLPTFWATVALALALVALITSPTWARPTSSQPIPASNATVGGR